MAQKGTTNSGYSTPSESRKRGKADYEVGASTRGKTSDALTIANLERGTIANERDIRLTLDCPPSVRSLVRIGRAGAHNTGKAFLIPSETVAKYKAKVKKFLASLNVVPIEGDLIVWMDVYRSRKSGDLDNYQKVLFDALQFGKLFNNDSQIVEIHARRFDDKDAPRVELLIRPVVKEVERYPWNTMQVQKVWMPKEQTPAATPTVQQALSLNQVGSETE